MQEEEDRQGQHPEHEERADEEAHGGPEGGWSVRDGEADLDELITRLHAQYFESGADIAETNTFNSTSVSMADYDLASHVYEMNVAGAQAARRAVEIVSQKDPSHPRFVAGAMGPTNRTCSISTDVHSAATRGVTYDELVDSYYEQARGFLPFADLSERARP